MIRAEIVVCEYCEKPMNIITDLTQLPAIPYEWIKDDSFLEKNSVYYCGECQTIYRKNHPFKTFFIIVKNILKLTILDEKDELTNE